MDSGKLLIHSPIPSYITQEQLNNFDVLFINCGASVPSDTVKPFVEKGGVVYASDFALSSITSAFPERNLTYRSLNSQITRGIIKDEGIRSTTGKNDVEIDFDLGGWRLVTSPLQSDVKVHIEGKVSGMWCDTCEASNESCWYCYSYDCNGYCYEEGCEACGTVGCNLYCLEADDDPEYDSNIASSGCDCVFPFTFSFPHGDKGGRVFYTSFHQRANNTEDMKQVLNYLVLRVSQDNTIGYLEEWAKDNGYDSIVPILGNLDAGESSITFLLADLLPGYDFAIINGVSAGNFMITLIDPNGYEYTNYSDGAFVTGVLEGTPPMSMFALLSVPATDGEMVVYSLGAEGITVKNPITGDKPWSFIITSITDSKSSFVVGIATKESTPIGALDYSAVIAALDAVEAFFAEDFSDYTSETVDNAKNWVSRKIGELEAILLYTGLTQADIDKMLSDINIAANINYAKSLLELKTPDDPCKDGHSFVEVVNADCWSGGWLMNVCTVCGEEVVIGWQGALGHDYEVEKTTIATCTTGGGDYVKCKRCDYETIINWYPATGHDYEVEKTTVATCTTGGGDYVKCKNCDDETIINWYPATGHDYQVTTKEATCEEGGYTKTICINCNDELAGQTVYTSPLGHSWSTTLSNDYSRVPFPATSVSDSCYVCVRPGCDEKDYVYSWTVKVVAATCTADGYTEYESNTGWKGWTYDYGSALKHDSAPPVWDGYGWYIKCSRCGWAGYTSPPPAM